MSAGALETSGCSCLAGPTVVGDSPENIHKNAAGWGANTPPPGRHQSQHVSSTDVSQGLLYPVVSPSGSEHKTWPLLLEAHGVSRKHTLHSARSEYHVVGVLGQVSRRHLEVKRVS